MRFDLPTLAVLALLLAGCAYTRRAAIKAAEPNTLAAILAQPGDFCYRTIYGQTVFAQAGVWCPSSGDVEREVEFMLDLTEATHDTFSGTRVVFTGSKFLVPRREGRQEWNGDRYDWAIGCAPTDCATLVVDVSTNWRKTLRHELEHRRRLILYLNGRAPSEFSDAEKLDWLGNHEPQWYWGVVERGER